MPLHPFATVRGLAHDEVTVTPKNSITPVSFISFLGNMEFEDVRAIAGWYFYGGA
jgi:hypothetical protein